MKNMTELVFIIDRSGSMTGMEDDTIGGFNSMLDKQNKDENNVLVSTVLFDHETKVLHDRVPLADVKHLTADDYEVRGSTALLDAIGKSIKHIRNIHKYAREEDRPDKTLFIITTDGMENSSTIYSYRYIRRMVEKQKSAGWEFLFLGANIDAIEVASHIGISRNRAANYRRDKTGTKIMYEGFGRAIKYMTLDDSIADDWKNEIDEDFAKRGD